MSLPELEQIHREVKESASRGNLCSQIVADVGLRHVGMASEDVLRALGGLVGAQGMMGATCGALTAAACFIAFAAHGRVDPDRIYMLIQELEDRFNKELVAQYPGNRCDDLLESDPQKVPTDICPPVIAGSIRIALELLESEGLEVAATP